MREKERRDNVTIIFPHLCFKVAPCSTCIESHILCFKVAPWFSYRESPMLSLSYTSGNFRYRTCLVYFNDGLPQIALGLREQASWMHTHLVLLLSFHTLIALVHPLHGNRYSLTLIPIDGHLHSPLIRLVDARLSPSFLSSPQPPYSIPPIVLYPWLTLMYCVKVQKVWEHQKYEMIAWLVIRVVHDKILCVMKMEHSQTIWFCRDNFLWPCYFEKTWLLC